MIIQYKHQSFDLSKPIDISTPLHTGEPQINCYGSPHFRTEPVEAGNFIGDMKKGGSLNYKNVFLNPHGNGTHTECVAHIADIEHTINKTLNQFHFMAQLISVEPEMIDNGDLVITVDQIATLLADPIEALIIRTIPNTIEKLSKDYNQTNPPYLHHETATFIREKNIQHLLIDLPSVDREEDDGKLLAHHAFWNYPDAPRLNATISELIYVPEFVTDGFYLLNLQIASFELDVSPSKPILFAQTDK